MNVKIIDSSFSFVRWWYFICFFFRLHDCSFTMKLHDDDDIIVKWKLMDCIAIHSDSFTLTMAVSFLICFLFSIFFLLFIMIVIENALFDKTNIIYSATTEQVHFGKGTKQMSNKITLLWSFLLWNRWKIVSQFLSTDAISSGNFK